MDKELKKKLKSFVLKLKKRIDSNKLKNLTVFSSDLPEEALIYKEILDPNTSSEHVIRGEIVRLCKNILHCKRVEFVTSMTGRPILIIEM